VSYLSEQDFTIRNYLFEKYACEPDDFSLWFAQSLLDTLANELHYNDAVMGMERVSDVVERALDDSLIMLNGVEIAALAAGLEGNGRPFFRQEDPEVYCAYHVGRILRGIVGWEPAEEEIEDGFSDPGRWPPA